MAKQRILLTGATSGLGAGAALGLARKHHVTVGGETWQQVTSFRERADEAGVKLEVIKLDLLNEVDLRHAADLEVDTLVLNAAVQEAGSIVDVPMDLVRRAFEINVFAQLDLARRIVPQTDEDASTVGSCGPRRRRVSTRRPSSAPTPRRSTRSRRSHPSCEPNSTSPGISVATINPGFYRTGFNETGAESYGQWSERREVLVPMPPAQPFLALQHDPQPMIDAMIEVIPDRKSRYRTMLPEDAIVETRLAQELAWTNRSDGIP